MFNYREFLSSGGEKKWQDEWEKSEIDRAEDFGAKPKKYVLDMFPYPSGAGLHVGHPEGYTATDIYSRYFRLRGFNVLHPMGWDAFGLPAENYAIKTGTQPSITTTQNIATFKRQIKSLGFSYDWSREINTTDPKYYKWTQWIFLQLFKKGLAYEATVPINWCPGCKTGLSNEEVKEGKCDRCGSKVERRDMRQWMLKITVYADRLLSGIESLDWPDSIKALQRNWIGRSEGAEVKFKIAGQDREITVYTTRPDTLFGATYMVLAPEHALVTELADKIENISEVNGYIEKAKNKSDLERTELAKEKTGVELKGIKAINPVNNQEIPIWISDYVLASYGTGAIMAVPAHDERDFEFANKFGIEIKYVIKPSQGKYLIVQKSLSPEKYQELKEKFSNNKIQKVSDSWGEFLEVFVDNSEEEKLLDFLSANLLGLSKDGGSWYADSMGTTNFIVMKDKIFDVSKSSVIEDFKNYGKEKGIPEEQLDVELKCDINVEIGGMINSEFLNDLVPAEAIKKMTAWLEEKGLGKKAVNYKLRDWVFSRQRYWGEPIPLVHCDNCKERIINNSLTINFYEQETWNRLASGMKTVESRALNPEDAERYFGNVKSGDNLKAVNKITKEEKYFEVKNVWQYKDLAEFFKDKEVLKKCYAPKPIPETLEQITTDYDYASDYVERINKNGIVAWEVEAVIPGIVAWENLPLTLPEVEKYEPTGTGESPLVLIEDWVNTTCPNCGGKAKRETNTMPQWAGSSWYWLRYLDPNNDSAIADQEKMKYWLPVDLYLGGAEHAVLHLLYARFWNMVLFDLGIVPQAEPFTKLVNQGLILGEDGEKMSKSRGNVVNPDDIIKEWGADAFRMYEMFMGPLEDVKPWSTKNIIGLSRLLEKISNQFENRKDGAKNEELETLLHKTIKKVGEDIESLRFNTAIAAIMILVNKIVEIKSADNDFWQRFLVILSPFAPHLSEELWQQLGHKDSIFKSTWPTYNEELIKETTVDYAVQVNGKLRGKLSLAVDVGEDEAVATAKADVNVAKYLEGQEIKKVIFVKGKMISFVI